jgi:hypothetical protein
MSPLTRLALAKEAYRAALRAVRAQSTPRTWARLLRAARNLREATDLGQDLVARGGRPCD